MAATIPPQLAAVAPSTRQFANRAAQLRNFRPEVSYWCEFYILQKVLSNNLHNTDPESEGYAGQLMDKLEQFKAANPTNDLVTDEVAAKVYLEEFAAQTLDKADASQRENKVTKQTADTFTAAATFLELSTIWQPLEPEVSKKITYAKYHAKRILLAYKMGKDPNESNPVVEEPAQPDVQMEDGIEAELKNMENDASAYKPPAVESAAESRQPSRPHSIVENDLSHQPATLPTGGTPLPPAAVNPTEPDVSPIDQADEVNSRAGSIGGGYFPAVPGEVQPTDAPNHINSVESVDQAPSAPSTFATSDPADFYSQPQMPPSAPGLDKLPDRSSRPTPHQMSSQPPVAPAYVPSPAAFAIPSSSKPAPGPTPRTQQNSSTGAPPGGYNHDDDAIRDAQKHAKWAISALNFDDVNTAVKELRIALNALGAS